MAAEEVDQPGVVEAGIDVMFDNVEGEIVGAGEGPDGEGEEGGEFEGGVIEEDDVEARRPVRRKRRALR